MEIIVAYRPFLQFNAAECPGSTFVQLSNACYKTFIHVNSPWYKYSHVSALLQCLHHHRRGSSSLPAIIKSQQDQDDIAKVIAASNAHQALEVYTGLKVQKKTFLNGTVRWLDEKNTALPYTNFADNQNPVGIACVLLSRKDNYKWITEDCNIKKARAVVCSSSQGEWCTRFSLWITSISVSKDQAVGFLQLKSTDWKLLACLSLAFNMQCFSIDFIWEYRRQHKDD